MLQISDRAATLLKDKLLRERKQSDEIFRLDQLESEVTLGLGLPSESDVLFEHEGFLLLAAPAELADQLQNATIDCANEAGGPRLVLQR